MASDVNIEREGKRKIAVRFPYDRDDVNAVRTIAGRNFKSDPGDKHWQVPLDLAVCRQLRELFGQRLRIGPQLRSWAAAEVQAVTRLGSIARANTGHLERLPHVLPAAFRAVYFGPLAKHALDSGRTMTELEAMHHLFSMLAGKPSWDPSGSSYQAADVRFLSDSQAPMNANHQGLGKTLEAICEVWESGREDGAHLVICPVKAIEATWVKELLHWQADADKDVEVFYCVGTKASRQATLEAFHASEAPVRWLVVNPAMIQWRKDDACEGPHIIRAKPKEYGAACKCGAIVDAHWHYVDAFPTLAQTPWRSIINDEVHKGNVRNHRSITGQAVNALKRAPACKASALSGTPMKKRGSDLWGVLHYLRPDVFTSYWNFAGMFFEIEDNGFGKKVGPLLEDRQEAFFEYLTPYMLRRTKDECLPWLPAKQYIDVTVRLEGKQLKQYEAMEADALVEMEDGEHIIASNVLAEHTRLEQFAAAYCEVKGGEVYPTLESAKLDALWEKLEETGIFAGESDDKTLIFSKSKRLIEVVHNELERRGVECATISGDTKDTGSIVSAFQTGSLKVVCIVTTAGGVSLTLDAADTAHFLDETWAPDDQEQAEDRIHRASRIHQVTIYKYIALGTIDEEKALANLDKFESHELILDVRRRLLGKRKS